MSGMSWRPVGGDDEHERLLCLAAMHRVQRSGTAEANTQDCKVEFARAYTGCARALPQAGAETSASW